MKGYIHSFESLATADGDGIRYAVFMMGCPMRCAYCHNPDTWEGLGTEYDEERLAGKIERYKPYFKDDGGATFSGGEPLLQAKFLLKTAKLLEEKGIKYVIDTSGAVKLSGDVKKLLKSAQMVILDLKFWNDESYMKYTGHDMSQILRMLDYLESIGKKTLVRTVVVPGINDTEECLEKYLPYLEGKKCVSKYELLGFHTMGFFKYEKLGVENPLADKSPLDKERRKELQSFVNEKLGL